MPVDFGRSARHAVVWMPVSASTACRGPARLGTQIEYWLTRGLVTLHQAYACRTSETSAGGRGERAPGDLAARGRGTAGTPISGRGPLRSPRLPPSRSRRQHERPRRGRVPIGARGWCGRGLRSARGTGLPLRCGRRSSRRSLRRCTGVRGWCSAVGGAPRGTSCSSGLPGAR